MKKISILLCISILVSCFSFATTINTSAKSSAQAYVEVSRGAKCEEVILKLYVEKFKGLRAANIEIEYNAKALQLTKDAELSTDANAPAFFDGGKAFDDEIITGSFYWQGSLNTDAKTYIGSYTFKQIKSEAIPFSLDFINYFTDSSGEYDISVSYSENNKSEHTFSSWLVVKQPTCIEQGKEESKCQICGYSESRIIPATGLHTYSDWTITKAPTCAVQGKEENKCQVCGHTESRTIAATGRHIYGSWKITPATVNADGKRVRTCITCGKEDVEIIPKLKNEKISFANTQNIKFINQDDLKQGILFIGEKTFEEIKSYVKNTDIAIKDKDGKEITSGNVGSGATINLVQQGKTLDTYTVIILGDNNGDAKVTAADARFALRISAKLEQNLRPWQSLSSDIDANDKVSSSDARRILRVAAKIDSF